MTKTMTPEEVMRAYRKAARELAPRQPDLLLATKIGTSAAAARSFFDDALDVYRVERALRANCDL